MISGKRKLDKRQTAPENNIATIGNMKVIQYNVSYRFFPPYDTSTRAVAMKINYATKGIDNVASAIFRRYPRIELRSLSVP